MLFFLLEVVFAVFSFVALVFEPSIVYICGGFQLSECHWPEGSSAIVKLWFYYAENFDNIFLNLPSWLSIMCSLDTLLFGPYYLYSWFYLRRRRKHQQSEAIEPIFRWITLIFSSMLIYSTIVYFAYEIINEMPAGRANFFMILINLPWAIVPLLAIYMVLQPLSLQRKSAIIILGGGIKINGEPNEFVKERLIEGYQLWMQEKDAYLIVTSLGTTHKPLPRNEAGWQITEAGSMANWCLRQFNDLPANRILQEASSWDTIGNAYFCRTVHTDILKLVDLTIVTSAFHMPRSKAIFEEVYSLPREDGAKLPYKLKFKTTGNGNLNDEALQAREEREALSLQKWQTNSLKFSSLSHLHIFLFTAHLAYNNHFKKKSPPSTPDHILQSY